MDGLIRIDEDLFDIAKRLKEIDSRYILYRNAKSDRFEIHADGALQIAVPFKELDARTLELARSTRIENADKLVAELDEHNRKLKCEKERCAKDGIIKRVEEVL